MIGIQNLGTSLQPVLRSVSSSRGCESYKKDITFALLFIVIYVLFFLHEKFKGKGCNWLQGKYSGYAAK